MHRPRTRRAVAGAAAAVGLAAAAFAAGVPSALGAGPRRGITIAGRGILEAVMTVFLVTLALG